MSACTTNEDKHQYSANTFHSQYPIKIFLFLSKNVVRTSKLIFIIVCLQKGAAITGSEVAVKCCSNEMADMGAAILFLKMVDMGAVILCLQMAAPMSAICKTKWRRHVGHFGKSNRGCGII